MKGILIIAHGSRAKDTDNTLYAIAQGVKKKLPEAMIETAFMEFSDLNLEVGLDALVEKGATKIVVVPYFLFKGIHIREDIPNAIEAYQKKNEAITISMGDTLGEDSRLSDILTDRVKAVL